MFLICGLGNPGDKFTNTRHNAGFDVIDLLASRHNIAFSKNERKALCGEGVICGQKVLLIKPQTFMNLSGESVGDFVRFYKLDPASQVIVISDDIALDAGRIRIRKKGSSGGHNGLKNIISHLGSEEFIRVRMGVGKLPGGGDMVSFVLGKMPPSDRELFDKAAVTACDACELIIERGPDAAMNRFN